jgi:hypothetical protein
VRLFKCHAVLPATRRTDSHVVRTYLTIARTWQEARARIRMEEPGAEFISLPSETPEAVITQTWTITPHEFGGLRLACDWNESQPRDE